MARHVLIIFALLSLSACMKQEPKILVAPPCISPSADAAQKLAMWPDAMGRRLKGGDRVQILSDLGARADDVWVYLGTMDRQVLFVLFNGGCKTRQISRSLTVRGEGA